ncbi:MAG: ATP-binding protein [Bacteroidales bacterium]|nr:ATP-binding protein [Bacteroidales bacterium]
MRKIIGRQNEISELQRCYNSPRAEFVVVSGRRRIGKTYLVNTLYEGQFVFSYVGGHNLSQKLQLRKFSKALSEYSRSKTQVEFKDWYDAFDALQDYLKSIPATEGKRRLIFIDEMPWIDNKKSDFVSALEYFWNSWGAMQDDIMFIASGSATSWLNDKLTENQGGLHARITKQIVLQPFCLKETEEYLEYLGASWDRYQIVQTYMALGGVPFYLSLINPSISFAQNIDALFFERNATLRLEFDELYYALFSPADKYVDVVKALAEKRKGLSRNELMKATGMQGSTLTRILSNLEKSDFIVCYQQYGHSLRDSIYKLTDFYTLFYFKFVENNNSKDFSWWQNNLQSSAIKSWQGFSFELVCLLHLDQIKKALGIAGISTSASGWRSDNAQIDLVIDRADRIVNLCEMKFSVEPFEITKDYADKLRERMSIFRVRTKCKLTLSNTFITTYGVRMGKNSAVVNAQVTMDELFG